MGFLIEHFVRARPYLFHLTAKGNLESINRARRLRSAASLATEGGREELLRAKRRGLEVVVINGMEIVIRDQAPLHSGNIRFEGGWSFQDLLDDLNRRVFFWPGVRTVSDYGKRHFERYRAERPVLLRVPTISLIAANPGATLHFSKFNSGSPRCTQGTGSTRGPQTFITCDAAGFTAAGVVEVTLVNAVNLPGDTMVSVDPNGPWNGFP